MSSVHLSMPQLVARCVPGILDLFGDHLHHLVLGVAQLLLYCVHRILCLGPGPVAVNVNIVVVLVLQGQHELIELLRCALHPAGDCQSAAVTSVALQCHAGVLWELAPYSQLTTSADGLQELTMHSQCALGPPAAVATLLLLCNATVNMVVAVLQGNVNTLLLCVQ